MTVNVSEVLRAAAETDPDGVALIETRGGQRRQLTWRELDDSADAIARALSGRGLVAGQRVAMVMANRIDLPIAYFGILRGGMVAVPMNPRSTTREVGRMLSDSGARVVLCDESGADQVREAVQTPAGVPGPGRQDEIDVVVDGIEPRDGETAFDAFLAGAPDAEPAAPRDAEALAVILYTSGTSGKPRGAMLSHRALIANIEQTAAIDPPPVSREDVCLGLLPMFHIYGLNAVLGQAVRQGASVLMVDGFDPAGLLDTIREEGVTNLPLAPPVIAAWAGRDDLREKLSGVRVVLSGASTLDPDLATSFYESSGHYVEQGYGLTETAPVIATTLGSGREPGTPPKAGSVGRPLPGIEVRCVEASGGDAAAGDPAELWIRGDNVFSGYWPDGVEGPREDGWYPTGDIGYVDGDGDVTLVDRLRELVIVSGFNVYPSEVEDVIGEVPGVAEVAVVGVPDEETGEAVTAFVVAESETDESTLSDAVSAHCAERLARFKQPTRVVVVSGLPHSATGKVAKGRLRALARSDQLGLGAS
ncbi:class I adenylate-forming enzyme family protein [Aeromicrobium terrae]|uniref:Long-chain fatty acid--CoA ligase n=1 Tax=Aeromicrobium terrae TaxID=2498846 RepID=A0A5C8NEF1_9ACTN|nr:AMP-binding protein [Aeromicrobium terrae]TXL57947.1 long-chain fatty acid--CoA ligase [Aeromicrobium terrae]